MALTNDGKIFDQMDGVVKSMISSNHMASVAALAVCLIEFDEFGHDYVYNMINNANVLGQQLERLGVSVYVPKRCEDNWEITENQHIWIDSAAMDWDAEHAVRTLYAANIVVNTLFLAGGGRRGVGAKGVRLGTTEVTRLGMEASEMVKIADGISRVLNGENPANVASEILDLRQRFTQPKFCFRVDDSTWDVSSLFKSS